MPPLALHCREVGRKSPTSLSLSHSPPPQHSPLRASQLAHPCCLPRRALALCSPVSCRPCSAASCAQLSPPPPSPHPAHTFARPSSRTWGGAAAPTPSGCSRSVAAVPRPTRWRRCRCWFRTARWQTWPRSTACWSCAASGEVRIPGGVIEGGEAGLTGLGVETPLVLHAGGAGGRPNTRNRR